MARQRSCWQQLFSCFNDNSDSLTLRDSKQPCLVGMKSQAHQLRLFPSLTDISMEPESSSSEYNKLDKLSRIIGERLANYNSSFSDSPLTHRHSIEGVSIAQAKYSSLCDHLPHTAYPFTETESLLSQRELRLIQSRPHTILEPHAIKECTISSRESAPAILRSPMQTWPPTRRGTSEPLTGLCLHHSDIDIEGIPEQSDRDELCERAANGGILSKEDLDSKISPRNNEGQNRAQDYRSNEKVWVQLSSTEPKRQSTEAETPHLGYTVSTERREQLPDLFPIDEEKTKIQRKDINPCNKIAHSLASTSELKPRLLDHVGENAHSSRPPDDSESWATVDSGDDDSSEGSIYFSCKTELPDSMLTEVGIELCVEKRDYVELMWLPMPGETLSACVGISDVPSVCVRFPHLSIVNCSQKTANKKTV